MLNHLIEVSIRALVLAAIAAGFVWFPRRKQAAMEHAAWTAVAAGMLALLAFGGALPRLPMRVLRSEAVPFVQPVEVIQTAIGGTHVESATAAVETRQMNIDWFAIGYAAIALAFLARFAMGVFLVRRLIAKSAIVGDFRESSRITVPLTVGWLRPVILLPMEWREWDRAKLDAVLAHEGAHARRHDGLIAMLAGVNRCLFWFHPLAWWLERRLGLLAELACDEACVAEIGDRESYARLLVEMAQVVDGSRGRLRGHALTMAAGSRIGRRVESVLREGRTFSRGLSWAGWAAIGLCGVPLIWGAGAVTLDRQAPALELDLPRLAAPKPPIVLAQGRPNPPTPAAAPVARPRFEVASVRVAGLAPNGRRCVTAMFSMDAGRVDITCISLQELMEHAFRMPQKQVGGPDWLHYHSGPKFDISAKLPPGASEGQVPEMLQALLLERFNLVYHREAKEQNVDALVVAKGGLKLEESTAEPSASDATDSTRIETVNGIPTRLAPLPNGAGAAQTNSRIGNFRQTMPNKDTIRWELSNTTVQGLADLMADRLKRPVVDMTGLKARYHMVLEVKTAPWDMTAMNAASDKGIDAVNAVIDDSLTEFRNNFQPELRKLGIELETRKAPVETLVVDRVEQTPTEN